MQFNAYVENAKKVDTKQYIFQDMICTVPRNKGHDIVYCIWYDTKLWASDTMYWTTVHINLLNHDIEKCKRMVFVSVCLPVMNCYKMAKTEL